MPGKGKGHATSAWEGEREDEFSEHCLGGQRRESGRPLLLTRVCIWHPLLRFHHFRLISNLWRALAGQGMNPQNTFLHAHLVLPPSCCRSFCLIKESTAQDLSAKAFSKASGTFSGGSVTAVKTCTHPLKSDSIQGGGGGYLMPQVYMCTRETTSY